MSTLSQLESSPIPYDISAYIESSFCVLVALAGVVGITLVLLSTRYDTTARNKLVWSLCFADLVVCIATVVYHLMDLVAGRFSTGTSGCLYQALIYYTMCCASIFSLLAFTLERYASIMYRVDLTAGGASVLISALWILSILIVFIGFIPNYMRQSSLIGIGNSRMFCRVAHWAETEEASVDASVGLATWLTIGIIVVTVAAMSFAYFQLFNMYFNARRARAAREGYSKKLKLSAKEKKLLVKSVTLVSFFALSYTPLVLMVIYEYAARTAAPQEFDSIVLIAVLVNSAFNSYLLILMDPKVKKDIVYMIHWSVSVKPKRANSEALSKGKTSKSKQKTVSRQKHASLAEGGGKKSSEKNSPPGFSFDAQRQTNLLVDKEIDRLRTIVKKNKTNRRKARMLPAGNGDSNSVPPPANPPDILVTSHEDAIEPVLEEGPTSTIIPKKPSKNAGMNFQKKNIVAEEGEHISMEKEVKETTAQDASLTEGSKQSNLSKSSLEPKKLASENPSAQIPQSTSEHSLKSISPKAEGSKQSNLSKSSLEPKKLTTENPSAQIPQSTSKPSLKSVPSKAEEEQELAPLTAKIPATRLRSLSSPSEKPYNAPTEGQSFHLKPAYSRKRSTTDLKSAPPPLSVATGTKTVSIEMPSPSSPGSSNSSTSRPVMGPRSTSGERHFGKMGASRVRSPSKASSFRSPLVEQGHGLLTQTKATGSGSSHQKERKTSKTLTVPEEGIFPPPLLKKQSSSDQMTVPEKLSVANIKHDAIIGRLRTTSKASSFASPSLLVIGSFFKSSFKSDNGNEKISPTQRTEFEQREQIALENPAEKRKTWLSGSKPGSSKLGSKFGMKGSNTSLTPQSKFKFFVPQAISMSDGVDDSESEEGEDSEGSDDSEVDESDSGEGDSDKNNEMTGVSPMEKGRTWKIFSKLTISADNLDLKKGLTENNAAEEEGEGFSFLKSSYHHLRRLTRLEKARGQSKEEISPKNLESQEEKADVVPSNPVEPASRRKTMPVGMAHTANESLLKKSGSMALARFR